MLCSGISALARRDFVFKNMFFICNCSALTFCRNLIVNLHNVTRQKYFKLTHSLSLLPHYCHESYNFNCISQGSGQDGNRKLLKHFTLNFTRTRRTALELSWAMILKLKVSSDWRRVFQSIIKVQQRRPECMYQKKLVSFFIKVKELKNTAINDVIS